MSQLRSLDLNLLIVFDTLLSERHVTRAAEKLFLSQSATSHALNRLREQLDDPILVRTERGMQPTPRALDMLPQIRRALNMLERTVAPPEQFEPAESERTFVIASTDYFEAVVLPDLIAHLQTVAPGIRIEIELISDRVSEKSLENRDVDLVVGLDATQEYPPHLISEPWLSEEQVCVVSQSNSKIAGKLPLDQLSSEPLSLEQPSLEPLSLKEYLELPHVVFSDLSGGVSSSIDIWLASQGLERRSISRNLNYTAAACIVAKTEAIITLPKQMGILFCKMMPLTLVAPPCGLPPVNMTLIYHPYFSKSPSIRWLRDQVLAFGAKVVGAD